MVSLNKNGSCCTRPICDLHHLTLVSLMLTFPTEMVPWLWSSAASEGFDSPSSDTAAASSLFSPSDVCNSYQRSSRATMVLLPDPEGPTRAVVFPLTNRALKPFRTGTFARVGYEKETLSNSMSSCAETSGSARPVTTTWSESIMAKKLTEALMAFVIAIIGATRALKTATTISTEKKTLYKWSASTQSKPERKRVGTTTHMMTVLISPICPSRKSFSPNQNARAKLEYIAKNIGDSCMPSCFEIFSPFLCESLTESSYLAVRDFSAPRERVVRIEEKTSPAMVAAFASAFSTCCTTLMTIGVVKE